MRAAAKPLTAGAGSSDADADFRFEQNKL